jgi:hypothetical protein
MEWERPAEWHPAKKGSASMRNGFLISVAALLTIASLAPAQMPYGYYRPAYQAYPPAYGYYAPRGPAYYAPAYPQASGYPQGYAQPYYPAPQAAYARPAQGQVVPAGGNPAQGQVINAAMTQPTEEAVSTGPAESSPSDPGRAMPSAPAAEAIQTMPAESSPGNPGRAMPTEPTSTSPYPPLPKTSLPGEPIRTMPAESTTSVATPPGEPAKAPVANAPGSPAASAPAKVTGVVPAVLPAGEPTHVGETYAGGYGTHGDVSSCPFIWANFEYLGWKVKAGPLPVPLVTIGDPVAAAAAGVPAGAIGAPGTVVVSPNQLSYPEQSGFRLFVGSWLDPEHTIGLEGSGFVLSTKSVRTAIASDASGNPALFVPFFNANPTAINQPLLTAPGEDALNLSTPVTGPGAFSSTATATIASLTRLWGFEANGLYHAWGTTYASLGLLAGFRYVDLQEQLTFDTTSVGTVPGLMQPIVVNSFDYFDARNQFFGGQVGAKFEARYWPFFTNVVAKVAVGDNHESMTINGNTFQSGFPDPMTGLPMPSGTIPQGTFAQQTNSGRHSHDQFAVIPELTTQLGVEPWHWVRIYAGYDFLYFSNVLRPGNLIDRNINRNLLSVPPLPGPLVGPAVPAPVSRSTGFWAQGVNIGVEVRY